MFLNVGRHLVRKTPILCLQHSTFHERYLAQVVVLFVCPPRRAAALMKGADRILTGHLRHDHGEVSYEARQRIIFCESNAFGDLVADLKDRERWLRLPTRRKTPATPASSRQPPDVAATRATTRPA